MVRKNVVNMTLQHYRQLYQPRLPILFSNIDKLALSKETSQENPLDENLVSLFPETCKLPIVNVVAGLAPHRPLKVGIVFSGGPAPGGNNVISGLFDALKKLNPNSELIGFLDGPGGVIKNQSRQLTEDIIASIRNQGGFDCIGTGRTKIETTEQFEAAAKTLTDHQLDGLVVVGGDDSNTNAAFLAEYCKQHHIPTHIVGVPKTIDGDLKNVYIEASFGFDTASKTYAETIGNLLKDSLSQKKYYFFIKLMGRSASHLTLECALKTQVNMALIGEEIASKKLSLADVVNQIVDLIRKRAELKKNYGVILIPEGLLEFIPECQQLFAELAVKDKLTPHSAECFAKFPESLKHQLLLDRDPHGNIQLSKIETERLLIEWVSRELSDLQFSPQPLFCGYEGRSAFPSNFDCTYCYALGHVAALLIQEGATGCMCILRNLTKPVEEWTAAGVPIVKMLHFETRKGKKQAVLKKALVNLTSTSFLYFAKEREKWQLDDRYLYPGPIQFEGPPELTDAHPLTLAL